ncbi:hypothetical protein [Apibacter adventoris]|uniref:Uncharacterized protein n=1 Tax=Apibacter adventoris TaxID=1679466 RepID=A0A2S8AC96_9FLAO|nr:hypothetical protein [Apibacter adventoris]PQL92359.1 hypothetical protein C4S77_06720 [Apibacter adventoris]
MKPYYIIDFSAAACLFEIRINDISVASMEIEGQTSTIIPINIGILESGIQNISSKILPLSGTTVLDTKAYLNFDIKLFDVTNDFIFKESFGEYRSTPVGKDLKLPIISYENHFQADVPYSFEGWKTGENLKDLENVKSKLLSAYNNLIKIINEKNYDLFIQKIKKRENFMATCMYLNETEKSSRINELISDFQSGFKVQPIPVDAIYVPYGYNKAAVLKKINGEPALWLLNEKTEEELMLDLLFYIPKGKTEFEIL